MIAYSNGDIFATTGVLVIPVNTVGVTGAGLANEWAHRYPDAANQYREYCHKPHMPFIPFEGGTFEGGDIVMLSGIPPTILAATKEHWRDPSRLDWVATIAGHLAERSRKPIGYPVLIPQLGCGRGGLQWSDVRPILVAALEPNTANTYILFGPAPRECAVKPQESSATRSKAGINPVGHVEPADGRGGPQGADRGRG